MKISVCQWGRIIQKNVPRGLPQSLKELKRWWSRAIVARSDGCSEAVNGNCGFWKAICFSGWCISSCESFDSKLTLRQRYVWSKKFWPPNSPDLNPLNYYVWSLVERVTNKSRHPNVTSLKIAIEAAFVDMDGDTLQRACEHFRSRIEVANHSS